MINIKDPKWIPCVDAVLSAAFAAAVFLFFWLKYPYHLIFQEQYQIFLCTADFARQLILLPGGLSAYVGRFLTQFFFMPACGAAIMAALLLAVQILSASLLRRRSLLNYSLSFIPAAILMVLYLDEDVLLPLAVSEILLLLAARIVVSVEGDILRRLLFIALVPLLFFMLGNISVVFVLIVLADEFLHRKMNLVKWLILMMVAVAVAVACPFVAQHFCSYQSDWLMFGLHYYRPRFATPYYLWLSAAVVPLVLVASAMIKLGEKAEKYIGWCAVLVIAVGAVYAVNKKAMPSKEMAMRYSKLMYDQQWNDIIALANEQPPTNPMSAICLNLALIKTGNANSLFCYPQHGTQCLLPEFTKDYVAPLVTAQVFYHLGMINDAMRSTFEAQECIPDYQKSAFCYKVLAECNLITGNYQVAKRYVSLLKNTICYRKWAEDVSQLLWHKGASPSAEKLLTDKAVESHPVYGHLRKFLIRKENDFFYSETETDSMLGNVYLTNTSNTMAYDYMISWLLLGKNVPRFVEVFDVNHDLYGKPLPRLYQEVIALAWAKGHRDFSGIPYPIEKDILMSFSNFMHAYKGKAPESYMKANFGNTYWYYFAFANN